eukprot:2256401-Prymnesium_polylepis.1
MSAALCQHPCVHISLGASWAALLPKCCATTASGCCAPKMTAGEPPMSNDGTLLFSIGIIVAHLTVR